MSFHEFELSMKPVSELRIKSSMNTATIRSRLKRLLQGRVSDEHRYTSLLQRIVPEVHKGFLQSFLNLIIEKD